MRVSAAGEILAVLSSQPTLTGKPKIPVRIPASSGKMAQGAKMSAAKVKPDDLSWSSQEPYGGRR